jgi:hypothetical protein
MSRDRGSRRVQLQGVAREARVALIVADYFCMCAEFGRRPTIAEWRDRFGVSERQAQREWWQARTLHPGVGGRA